MSFDWSHYLKLAEILSGTSGTPLEEAAHRAAISRAYYAAFCSCRNFVRDRGIMIPSELSIVHGQVIDHFSKSSDPLEAQIGKLLTRMRSDRNSADYDDELTGFPTRMSKISLSQAKQVLDLLEKL